MKIKKLFIILVGLLFIMTTISVGYTSVNGIKLPDDPVTLNADDDTDSYFIITLSDVPPGNDVTNGVYVGWCADMDVDMERNTNHIVTLYDSYDPLPFPFDVEYWDEINWILNHKGTYTMMEIQYVFWYLLGDFLYDDLTTNEKNLVGSAIAENGYIPGPGDIIAIVAVPEAEENVQCTFLELVIPSTEICCRWTGGGTIGERRDPRVTHGFELHCSVDQLPNNLEVNWGGDHFHLELLTFVECWDDLDINPHPPRAGCDTIHGEGEGRYNGESGYNIEFVFTDAGEPGKNDQAWIKITDPDGDPILEVSGNLKSGNQQAHRCTGKDAR